jgi:hypothetical protein
MREVCLRLDCANSEKVERMARRTQPGGMDRDRDRPEMAAEHLGVELASRETLSQLRGVIGQFAQRLDEESSFMTDDYAGLQHAIRTRTFKLV